MDLNRLKNKHILVIGDCMLDEYHWCTVQRISPEAPVPVCTVTKTTLVPGGAANVAHNIKTLGCSVTLLGTVGLDSSGDKLRDLLQKKGIQALLVQDQNKPTILKSRIVAHQQHVVRVDREDTTDISLKTRAALFAQIAAQIQHVDAVLISDYLKGTLPTPFTKRIIEFAKSHNKIVVVDPKGDHYLKYKGATILTPNFGEFKALIKKNVMDEATIEKEAKKLISKLQLNALLITRSEKGMSLITDTKLDIPTQAKEVYDITGAGDTVISTLTLALAADYSFEKAARIANQAAGIVVGKIGTSTITLEELAAARQ